MEQRVKYFYDAKVGRTAHLWKVHREVCHKCAGKWLELYPKTSATAQRYLQSQASQTL